MRKRRHRASVRQRIAGPTPDLSRRASVAFRQRTEVRRCDVLQAKPMHVSRPSANAAVSPARSPAAPHDQRAGVTYELFAGYRGAEERARDAPRLRTILAPYARRSRTCESLQGERVEDRPDDGGDALAGDDGEEEAEACDRDRWHDVDGDRGERQPERVRCGDPLAADIGERMRAPGCDSGDDAGRRKHEQGYSDIGEEGERLRRQQLAAADGADEDRLQGAGAVPLTESEAEAPARKAVAAA